MQKGRVYKFNTQIRSLKWLSKFSLFILYSLFYVFLNVIAKTWDYNYIFGMFCCCMYLLSLRIISLWNTGGYETLTINTRGNYISLDKKNIYFKDITLIELMTNDNPAGFSILGKPIAYALFTNMELIIYTAQKERETIAIQLKYAAIAIINIFSRLHFKIRTDRKVNEELSLSSFIKRFVFIFLLGLSMIIYMFIRMLS